MPKNNTRTLSPLIVIVGPTASGKTDFGVALAKKFQGEVINADPWQMYRGFNIGTAKPRFLPAMPSHRGSKNQRPELVEGPPAKLYKEIPHHLFDIAAPTKTVTVQEWKKRAIETITDIHRRGKLPIVVGGTWLYICALTDNLEIPEVPANTKLRAQLALRIKKEGLEPLAKELLQKDPDAAQFLDAKNPRRVIRALEVIAATGKPFSAQRKKGPALWRVLILGLLPSERILAQHIQKRLAAQLKTGLEQEVRALSQRYGWGNPRLAAVGYREWRAFFEGNITRKELTRLITLHTLQLAKKQMRWLIHDQRITRIKNFEEARKAVERFLFRQHGL